MTFIINITVPEGIVFAADSRQTFTNQRGDVRVSSDYGHKLFQITPRVAGMTAGWSFLDGRSIHSHIQDFRLSLKNQDLPVEDIVRRLGETLTSLYQADVDKKLADPVAEDSYAVVMMVGGYDPGGNQGKVYEVYAPKGEYYLRRTTNESPGSAWRGYTPVVARLLKGYDPRLRDLDGFTEQLGKTLDDGALGYLIDYWSMTLQDAVDQALFLVHTTIQMQRISDGIGMAPGSSADCGGEIDVAVIDSLQGFQWIQCKQLRARLPGQLSIRAE